MKISIIRPDNKVYVDGYPIDLDLSSIDSSIDVIQWNTELNSGHIELALVNGQRLPNETITDFSDYEWVKTEWDAIYAIQNQPYINTAEDNKAIAREKLFLTDYVYLPDVNIINTTEFDTYRSEIRQIFFNPVGGDIEWPTEPTPIWA